MAEPKIETEGPLEPIDVMRAHAQISRSFVLATIAVAPDPLRQFLTAEPGEPGEETPQPEVQ